MQLRKQLYLLQSVKPLQQLNLIGDLSFSISWHWIIWTTDNLGAYFVVLDERLCKVDFVDLNLE